ncbi:MAG TPA: hypothetical protein VNL73_03895 [Verrucomicrobiae bacterium]|nr:hypothetical protein [Verrucomicrobiae bacterium]
MAKTPSASVEQLYRQQVLYGRYAFLPLALDSAQELLPGTEEKGPKQRSVAKAAVLSLLVPGAGQFYVGEKVRAIPFFLVDVAGWATYFGFRSQGNKRENEYRVFADQHWNPSSYFVFLDTALGISSRSDFDPTGRAYDSRMYNIPESEAFLRVDSGFIFSHHIPTRNGEDTSNFVRNLEYYESLGKYDQFFAGWDDLANRRSYLGMRADANSSFSNSKIGLVVSLADRLVAAVDAALGARRFNRKLDKDREIELSLRLVRYNGERMPKLSAIYRF